MTNAILVPAEPANPVQAVVHPDPYPYYARLVAGPALAYDEELKLWVAAGSRSVLAVLADPACRVRPLAEPVPSAIAGQPAGEVFGHLVRMNEGEPHARPKLALQRALASFDLARAGAWTAELAAQGLADAMAEAAGAGEGVPRALTRWVYDTPVQAVAGLLGFSHAQRPQVAAWMADFVACLTPLSSAGQLEAASGAARRLLQAFDALLHEPGAAEDSLVHTMQREALVAQWTDRAALLANLVGLLSQTYEATAGLLGNSIVALLRMPQWQARLRDSPASIAPFVEEVSRWDPPVQNTRRFVAEGTQVAGVHLPAGSAILLVLAAANRDEAANPEPQAFRPDRVHRQLFGFGHGRHACPGQALAQTLATAALRALLQAGMPLQAQRLGWRYRPSVNGRLPEFMPA